MQLADTNPGKTLSVLLARLPIYEAIVETERTGHFYYGLKHIENIGRRAMSLGWRQFTFIAEALREEIDWLDNPFELAPPTPEQLVERRRTLAKAVKSHRIEKRAKKEHDRQDRLKRLADENADDRTKAIDQLLCRFERNPDDPNKWDSTWDPVREWLVQLSLRALDPEQTELHSLLTEDNDLDISDPIKLRKAAMAFDSRRIVELIDAVRDLDAIMDTETSRRWNKRRSAIHEMVDQYSILRAHPKLQDSAVHIFQTKIKDICERTGLTAFYENVLLPLIEILTRAFSVSAKERVRGDMSQETIKENRPNNTDNQVRANGP